MAKQNTAVKNKSISYARWGYIFIIPFFIVYAIFTLYPQILTVYNSFFEYYRDGLTIVGPRFVGLQNYKTLFEPGAAGYVPILAHAERYMKLSVGAIKMLKQDGILVQINAGSCFGTFGARARHLAKKILALRLADFVGSDGHNMNDRSPEIRRCYEFIAKKYSREYADFVCRDNAVSLFFK